MTKESHAGTDRFWKGFAPAMAILAVVLAALFHNSFAPGLVHFSSDGPLGVLMSRAMATPDVYTGCWADLDWLGDNGGANRILPTYILLGALGPVGFAKFYPPLTLFILGACAWIFFRTIRLSSGLCGVASIAAALNSNYFSNSCWGVGTRAMTLSAAFLALAALMSRRPGSTVRNVVLTCLAGLAVGVGVIEGADNGAIFSMFIGGFVFLQALFVEEGWGQKIKSGLGLALVVAFALVIAAPTAIQLKGLGTRTRSAAAVPEPSPEAKAGEAQRNWVFATQWSLPPIEMLRVILPGFYGYRMDTPDGGQYRGRVGEYWDIPDGPDRRNSRNSGAGEYAGVLVVLIGLWGLVQAWRGALLNGKPIYDERERKYVFIWAGLLIPAVLFSWGYHAPFYKLVYALPYFSTIRNPMKFMHAGHMCLMILFAYGLLGLSRRYLETALTPAGSFGERFTNWRTKALPAERYWVFGMVAAVALSMLLFLVYTNSRGSLTRQLQEIGFSNPNVAEAIARHSAGEIGRFVVVLAASVAFVGLILIGGFAGSRRKWAVVLLGGLLTLDLAAANRPWIQYEDYRVEYAMNPVVAPLAKEPWLHRVTAFPDNIPNPQASQLLKILNFVWKRFWLRNQGQFYSIQAIDMTQDPRPTFQKTNYIAHVSQPFTRYWELSNTRYVLGIAGLAESLNQQLDPVRKSFRTVLTFDFPNWQQNDFSPKTNDTGPWALIEFGGALPRAGLYSRWQVSTDDEATLKTLGDPAFDPHSVVLVNQTMAPPAATASNVAPGTVEFVSYAPKHIVLKATATAPSVLLLNDQYDPNDWKVQVDGKDAPLLRCNYLMRGVQVEAGSHEVVFHFQPSLTGMTITLTAMVLGILGCVSLLFFKRSTQAAEPGDRKKADKPSPANK